MTFANTVLSTATTKACKILLFLFICHCLAGCSVQQDRIDALEVAAKIHSQLQRRDFLAIYRESSKSFKEVGGQAAFVTRLESFFKDNGSLKNAQSIAYGTVFDANVGVKHMLLFNLEFEQGLARERLILARSDDGQLMLWDLAIEPFP